MVSQIRQKGQVEIMEIVGFELEEIGFKYQRLRSVLQCIRMAAGQKDNDMDFALYEVIEEVKATNDRLKKMINDIIHGEDKQ